MTMQSCCTAFDTYNKKKTVLVTEISERNGTPELVCSFGRRGMTGLADICSWIALKHETEMVREMCITFSTALENNATLFPNYT